PAAAPPPTFMHAPPLGKFLAVVWLFISVIYICYFIATITSAITLRQLDGAIRGPQDLAGKRVATTAGSTTAKWLREQRIDALEVTRVEAAYEALAEGRVQAVVADAPVVLHYASHAGRGRVQAAGPVFRRESYGIVVPAGSPLRKQINEALL